MLNIAALQLSTLPMSEAKLDYYFRICKTKNISLVMLGEYVLNSFFKEIERTPPSMIKEQSFHKINVLKKLCKEYDLTVVSPIILIKEKNIYKSIAKFTPNSSRFYNQNILIPYKHWNEENFFSNDEKEIKLPIFRHEGLKFAIINGFEVHFDVFWQEANKNNVDVVLTPCSATFDSHERWNELLRMRAFTNNMYILKANRVGVFKDKIQNWYFYGNSALFSPFGDTQIELGKNEEILIASIDKKIIHDARKLWKWKDIIKNKDI